MADNMSTEPRDIIAQAVLHYLQHELRSIDPRDEASQTADVALAALTAAGRRVIGPASSVANCNLLFDYLIAEWHDGPDTGQSLHEFLGMTWGEYSAWVSDCRAVPARFIAAKTVEGQ